MPRREQRAGSINTTVTRPSARTSGRIPGDCDVVQQPGYEMEDDQSARAAGEAVSGVWGGRPKAGSPQVGRKQ